MSANTVQFIYNNITKYCHVHSRVEEEMRLHQDTADSDTTSRRPNTSARRSFFRRKKHQRSSSRDSKELASFSNTQLSWFSDSGMLNDENSINSYIRMERLDCE